jgi:hypothetical protein
MAAKTRAITLVALGALDRFFTQALYILAKSSNLFTLSGTYTHKLYIPIILLLYHFSTLLQELFSRGQDA